MPSSGLRRLPVYLLLDCSGSMMGDPIVAVNEGLGLIYSLLMREPRAVETVYLSVIRFADAAEQEDFTALVDFVPPALTAGGRTAMGSAFHVLVESIQNDLNATTDTTKKGDYRPLVYLLTDGQPTDVWQPEVAKIKALSGSQRPTIIALGCGDDADPAMLRQVTDEVYLMRDATPEQIKAYFKWITGSIAGVSKALAGGGETADMVAPTAAVSGVIKYGG